MSKDGQKQMWVDDETHRQVKILAAEKNLTMMQVTRIAVLCLVRHSNKSENDAPPTKK